MAAQDPNLTALIRAAQDAYYALSGAVCAGLHGFSEEQVAEIIENHCDLKDIKAAVEAYGEKVVASIFTMEPEKSHVED